MTFISVFELYEKQQLEKKQLEKKQLKKTVDVLDQIAKRRAAQEQAEKKPAAQQTLLELDKLLSPLPLLDPSELTDPNKGLWEFWQQTAPEDYPGLLGRNPAEDVQPWPVTIDFGTSSTVVAFKDGGKKRLIRVGVKDFFAKAEAEHFENPTVLEFVDLDKALPPWQQSAYKPGIKWGDLRCSHEALAGLRDNEGDPAVTASILTNLKHWALREGKEAPLRIQDRVNNRELILPPLELKNPVKGQPLSVSSDDALDPIELYAYYLGLAINWRKRGIFLRYYMTFPVTYPQRIKEKILSSFRRGLQRSLPETLIQQDIFNRFEVAEVASEPAAFAVAAMQMHGIEPTEEGVTYGVFDFGGGTTDFDFGIYREPNQEEEEDDDYEVVFEHFGASGDSYLGGENLLENLAYRVFQQNQEILREHRIAISKPVNGGYFTGSEMLIDTTQAALTNSQLLMARLRSFMEEGEENSEGIEKIKLIKRSGEEVVAELEIPYEDLNAYLAQRMQSGVDKFFAAMNKAFEEHNHQPEQVHVMLAGNASNSLILQNLFSKKIEQNDVLAEGDNGVCVKLYQPLSMSDNNPEQVTAKTGVALGMLDLVPGSAVKVVNHAHQQSNGEGPSHFMSGGFVAGCSSQL
ncbi:hypothetical protein BTA35_0202100 [Oceanospirillum linum]|uniref:Molecular chaperone DnaK n=1 Tax=Oceanospirillum linum TaxID=966 RepID=A0A1T1HEV3_OCELI|nr:hypothetical protein [Oceanospirillum linum]OOV88332.1 hypothetical protein BTA35_0202100 [Oceanospirillum linum]